MEELSQPLAILTLGKKIVRELEQEGAVSTMDRWLAHYLSEKMIKAESETDSTLKAPLEKECFDLILNIWERRFKKSGKFSPLFQLEETLEILESFVIQDFEIWRYQSEKPKGKLNVFAEKLSDSFYRIMEAVITLSVLPDKFLEAKSWHEKTPELLDENEKKLVEDLNELIRRALDRTGLTFEELYELRINPPAESYTHKLASEIIEILQQLIEFCKTFPDDAKNDPPT